MRKTIDSKIAVCPICGKKTLLRIQIGAYLREYPIRVNCINCKALIRGSYIMQENPNNNVLYLVNSEIEECYPDPTTLNIPGVDYVAEISGELPCRNVREYEGGLPTSPFLTAVDNLESVEDRIKRLTYFAGNMEEWKKQKSTAFQLLDEGSIEYIARALKNKMGEYAYECDHYLKSLHCLQEVVREETKYLFVTQNQDTFILNLIEMLSTVDKDKVDEFVDNIGGVQELMRLYRRSIEVFSNFMKIYPNILPAETYLHFKKQDSENVCISTCTFADIKNFYQDAYESLASLLFIPVCLDNIVERDSYIAFSRNLIGKIQGKLNDKRNTDITNELQAYMILDNGLKINKLSETEMFQKMIIMPSNSYLRNGIGHNNYNYDGIMQRVIAYDLKNPDIVKYEGCLMDVAKSCIEMAKSIVYLSETILFLMRREFRKDGISSIMHPRFYNKAQVNDLCPCGSGKKYKKCCMNGVENTLRKNP